MHALIVRYRVCHDPVVRYRDTHAPRPPPQANTLMAIKRVTLGKAQKVKLDFTAPSAPGSHELTLFFMCDSWLGCDQEYEVQLEIAGGDMEQ